MTPKICPTERGNPSCCTASAQTSTISRRTGVSVPLPDEMAGLEFAAVVEPALVGEVGTGDEASTPAGLVQGILN